MLDAHAFNVFLEKSGIDFYSGVPCSLLGALMQSVETNNNYIGATIEGEALALSAGAWLAGKKPAVFLQNSGLGNLVNTITSLNIPFGIPALLVIGWRGMPGVKDEPQHETMGAITPQLLDMMGIPYHILPDEMPEALTTAEKAIDCMLEKRIPVALLVKPKTFIGAQHVTKPVHVSDTQNQQPQPSNTTIYGIPIATLPSRFETLTAFTGTVPADAAVVATTGKCGRELFSINDSAQHLYMVGAMGSASAVGLGIALNNKKSVFILDGDGAALMRLGTFALIGREAPENLIHILLDNGTHDSTGGQKTGSEAIDFCSIAHACGYASTAKAWGKEGFDQAVAAANFERGPHFIHVPIKSGSHANLLRPTVTPRDVATRFSAFLSKRNSL